MYVLLLCLLCNLQSRSSRIKFLIFVVVLQGELALAFGELLRKLWSSGRTPVAPRAFKTKLARFAPQFSGYNQHDSQVDNLCKIFAAMFLILNFLFLLGYCSFICYGYNIFQIL